MIAAGRDGQRVALQRGRGLCAQGQRTAGEEYESVRIIRGEIRAVILRAARKQHGVRSGDAAAEFCAVCQFAGDREQGSAASDTNAVSKNSMEADPRIPIHNKPASGQTTVEGNQNGFPQNK